MMIPKEEDTLVLLSSVEEEDESLKEGNYPTRRSFTASGISSSILCGSGIFIANIVVWCIDPKESCKDSEVFRVTALLGGIISSLIVGRAVDFYGRQSSLMFSVLFWLFVTILLAFLPSTTQTSVNYYDAPLSEYYMWPSDSRPSSVEFPSSYTINTYEAKVSVPKLVSYSYTQNYSLDNQYFPTQPTLVKSVSTHSFVSPLSVSLMENDSLSGQHFSHSKNKMLQYSSLKPVNSMINLRRSSVLIPLFTFHLFLGAASAASVVAVSVYIFETSPSNSRAWWLALSDFFSSLFIFSLPVIQGHLILLAIVTWLPVIALGLLKIVPIHIPEYLSLPRSPHFLLLTIFMHKRNALLSNSATTISYEGKGESMPNEEGKNKQFSSIFRKYGDATFGYIKIPFKKAKIKIHDASSKSSASDSDDCCGPFNDKLKHVMLETKHVNFQSVSVQNGAGTDFTHYQQPGIAFPEGVGDYPSSDHAECVNVAEKNIDWENKNFGGFGNSITLNEDVTEDCDDEGGGVALSESNENYNACNAREECATLVHQSWGDSNNAVFSWQEKESLRTLRYLNGKKQGFLEWKKINKMLKDDVTGMKYSAKNTFFRIDILSFCSTMHLVLRVGLPLVIIHIFSSEYGVLVSLSETIMSKLGFCDLSGPAVITSLQVMSSGASVLVLDKLRNQMVLNCAAVVMTSSLIILWFLFPSFEMINDDGLMSISRNVPTPNPALPTLYPLLPTPLPQVLQGRGHICSNSYIASSPSAAWDNVGTPSDSKKDISINLPIIWFSALILVLYVVVSSMVLLPLTRLVLVSYFPIDKRGSGVGICISIEWVLRLVMIFFPCSFFNSNVVFFLCSVALFSSILFLCVAGSDLFAKDSFFPPSHKKRNNSHLLSHNKISNMSEVNSTAV